jgi:hypothetical protein
VEIVCRAQDCGAFDLSGYAVQTYLGLGDGRYLPTEGRQNLLTYKIPAEATVGQRSGTVETRIFGENGDVFEVITLEIEVIPALKPDITTSNN